MICKKQCSLPSGVQVTAEVQSNTIYLDYVGTLDALVASGAITLGMMERRAAYRKGSSRGVRDDSGRRFRLHRSATKAAPGRMTLHRYAPADLAMELPGMREMFPAGLPQPELDDASLVEKLCPGIRCTSVHRDPHCRHSGGHGSISVYIEGCQAAILKVGVVTPAMIDSLKPREHRIFSSEFDDLQCLSISCEAPQNFQVKLTDAGSYPKTIRSVIELFQKGDAWVMAGVGKDDAPKADWKEDQRHHLLHALNMFSNFTIDSWNGFKTRFGFAQDDMLRIEDFVAKFGRELTSMFDGARVLDPRRQHLRLVVSEGNARA